MNFDQAVKLVEEELKAVEADMSRNFLSEIMMIPTVSRYLISGGGKRFRPLLLLLSSRLSGYHGTQAIPLASSIEFIHTSALLHDDVVDGAFLRRGMASANSVWGNGASVLVGDFLFAKSFSMTVQGGDLRILELLSHTTTRMAEGEVMQLTKMGNPGTTEEDYTYVVINKTAVLISAACQIGGILGKVSPAKERALGEFGLNLGIGFQLMDDLLDYVSEEHVLGKTIGKDLSEGKVTLPLIRALGTCPPREKDFMIRIIQDPNRSEDDLKHVMDFVLSSDSIDYTAQRAESYIRRAGTALAPFPPSEEKEALLSVAEYTIKRKQ